MQGLDNRRVLLGLSGGIACYKSADLARRLREAGADVQVVMTSGATEFITPLTMQAVSGRPVRQDLFDLASEAAMGHIELARWADTVLIAPASADFMARMAGGRADDLLTTLCLATEAPVAVAPAMNRVMWNNQATQDNVTTLRKRGVAVFGPGEGEQACGEVGSGRMLEPLELVERLIGILGHGPLTGLSVLVSAGPTREAIDPVRFLSNRSSGKMGYAVASAAQRLGATVTLVSGPVDLSSPRGVSCIDVETAKQMHDAVMEHAVDCDIYVGAAAVADYRPISVAEEKIKKSQAELSVEMVKTDDILADVSERFPDVFTLGFAAETDNVIDYARAKLHGKRLNMIAANKVGAELAFDQDNNQLTVLWTDGEHWMPQASKTELADALMRLAAERYTATHSQQVTLSQ